MSCQVLFQHTEMRISWLLCNNSEIHLWLWKLWSLVVWSTKHLLCYKRTQRRQKQTRYAFFAKNRWTCYPTNNCSIISHFNQPNIEKKNCVWTKKYKRLMEMCIVQDVETRSVFTFQLIKSLVFMSAKNARPAATFWIFFLGTKNWQLCCLAAMVHIAFQARRVATQIKSSLQFRKKISNNHNQAHTNLSQKNQKSFFYSLIVSTPRWLIQWTKFSFTLSFYKVSVYREATSFSQPPTTVLSSLLTLDQIQWFWLWKISSKECQ